MPTFHHNEHILTWEQHSDGDHIFILISGWSSVQPIWNTTIQCLRPFGRCITLDLPGHYPAQTPRTYRNLSQAQLLDLEMGAIQHICGDQPVTLIGHSTGGFVATGVAARLPDQVKRVITVNGLVWGPPTGILKIAQWMLSHRLFGVYWGSWKFTQLTRLTLMFGMMFYTHRWLRHWRNPAAWQTCQTIFPCFHQQSLYNLAILLRTIETCDIRTLSTTVCAPLLAMVGTHDPIVAPAQSYWLAQNLCNAELQRFEGVGHMPFFESPSAYEQALRDWIIAHPV